MATPQPTGGEIAAGILLPLLGGLLNASWNMPTKEGAPAFVKCVGEGSKWEWIHFWLVFSSGYLVFNILFCGFLVGWDNFRGSFAEAGGLSVAMVVIMSCIWGFGTIFFGMAIKVAGVGLGTALSMSIIIIMGVVWPAIINGLPGGIAGPLIIVGVVIGVAGFLLMGYACLLREKGRAEIILGDGDALQTQFSARTPEKNDKDSFEDVDLNGAGKKEAGKAGHTAGGEKGGDLEMGGAENGNGFHGSGKSLTGVSLKEARQGEGEDVKDVVLGEGAADDAASRATQSHAPSVAPSRAASRAPSRAPSDEGGGNSLGVAPGWSPLSAVGLCFVAGLLSSMLQLAFVLGGDAVTRAEERGVSPLVAADVVWFIAFTIAGSMNLVYTTTIITKNRSWGVFDYKAPGEARRVFIAFVCSGIVCFSAHIHLYGTAAAMLGKELGPVVSWPILMCSTLLFGQAWGFFLREWVRGDRGLRENVAAMAILMVAIAITAAAGGVDQSGDE